MVPRSIKSLKTLFSWTIIGCSDGLGTNENKMWVCAKEAIIWEFGIEIPKEEIKSKSLLYSSDSKINIQIMG